MSLSKFIVSPLLPSCIVITSPNQLNVLCFVHFTTHNTTKPYLQYILDLHHPLLLVDSLIFCCLSLQEIFFSYIVIVILINILLPSLFFSQSMGGHGALICAFKNPGMYKSVSAFSPICNPINCPWGVKAFSGYLGAENKETWKEYDACELVKKYNGPPLEILVDQVRYTTCA